MYINEEDARRYLKSYNLKLTLGQIVGRGGTSCVFELSGTSSPQVIKMMDTRCDVNSDDDSLDAVDNRRLHYKYFSNELEQMKILQECPYIMPVLGSCVYEVDPEDREELVEMRSYRAVFMLHMPKMQKITDYIAEHEVSERFMVQMARDVCCALQFCEDKQIIHRDVKPANIFVCEENGELRFVLGDFGYCKRMDEGCSSQMTCCGTYIFMDPVREMDRDGKWKYTSDLFSLGSTLYYLLSCGKTPRQFIDKRSKVVDSLKNISPEFGEVILRAIQPNPRYRYQHAGEMLKALERLHPSEEQLKLNNQFAFRTREELLHDQLERAIEYAKIGRKHGESDCNRLLAFCFYQLYLIRTSIPEGDRKAYLRKSTNLLEKLIYKDNDPIARCIRACIYFETGDYMLCSREMKKSADDGCVLAQYFYGRALYEAIPGFPLKREDGREQIRKAARENFGPAVWYLKRINRMEVFGTSEIEINGLKNPKWLRMDREACAELAFFL